MSFGTFDNEKEWFGSNQSPLDKFTGGGVMAPSLDSSPPAEAPLEELEDEPPTEEIEESTEPKIQLSNAQFIRPNSGYEMGEKCRITVDVEVIGENPDPNVHFALYADYKDSKNEFLSRTGAKYSNGKAETSIHLAYPSDYLSDLDSHTETDAYYYCIASHDECVEEARSQTLELPDTDDSADAAAQAAVLTQAAEDGTPFCEECEKLRKQKEKENA
ncbi:MAG: hypothetical protein OCC49_08290 [Fibrobacterales bacterium]